MRAFFLICTLLASQALSFTALAADEAILDKLKQARPDFDFGEIVETPVSGIYQVEIINGPTVYMHVDGEHFFVGDLFEVGPGGLVNLGERALEKKRVEELAKIGTDEMIVFGPENPKASVHVFTDVDCYYCQKLHREVPRLTELGVEVRYLAYPRAGVGSPSYRKIASAWCAEDPNESLTKLKAGESIEDNVCEGNPVSQQYELGGKLGVKGTPALVTESGKLLPGYMPADRLAKELGL